MAKQVARAGWRPAAVAAGVAAASVSAFISLIGLALAAAEPIPDIMRLAVQAVALAAAAASTATWLLGGAVAGLLAEEAARRDLGYRSARRSMSHRERIAAVEEVARLAAGAAAASRLARLWGLAAATLGVGGIYSAVACYRLLWECSRPTGRAGNPSPVAVFALLVATLGLGGLLAAGWARRLAAVCSEAPKGPASSPSGISPSRVSS